MQEIEEVFKTIQTYFSPFGRSNSHGWIGQNCKMCHLNGEPTRDSKKKAGVNYSRNSFVYKCFRCNFKASWRPGKDISKDLEKLFLVAGMSARNIHDLKILCIEIKKKYEQSETTTIKGELVIKSLPEIYKTIQFPKNTKSLWQLERESCSDPNFIKVLEYIKNRGSHLSTTFRYYWSPEKEFKERLIIPFYHNKHLVGYTGRYVGNNKDTIKYFSQSPYGFIFNNQQLLNYNRKYAILVEGPFDAISINCMAYLGNDLTNYQAEQLKNSNKKIIVVPDRDKAGKNIIDTAINCGFYVSFPPWEGHIKDIDKSVLNYGRIATMQLIFENLAMTPLEIRMKSEKWFNYGN